MLYHCGLLFEIWTLIICMHRMHNTLIFKILNPYPYIKYEEMNTWFDLEHSSKGAKHGLGLYYVKQICQKYRANIICRNVECQGKNWIEMNLEIEKANR